MVLESLARLPPDGLLCVQFGENRLRTEANQTARYLATAREAFRRLGIHDFDRARARQHDAAGSGDGDHPAPALPWTPAEVSRFEERVAAVPGSVVRHARDMRTSTVRSSGSSPFRPSAGKAGTPSTVRCNGP